MEHFFPKQQPMARKSEDEMDVFSRRISTLRGVTEDISDIIKRQNSRLRGAEPLFGSTFARLRGTIRQLGGIRMGGYSGWIGYAGASLFFLLLLFVFFFVF